MAITCENILKGAGLTETYSYSFASEKQLEQYGFTSNDAIRLKNPLSIDQAYMRPSLVPTLLTSITENQARFQEADLFEVAPVYLQCERTAGTTASTRRCDLRQRCRKFIPPRKGILERLFAKQESKHGVLIAQMLIHHDGMLVAQLAFYRE